MITHDNGTGFPVQLPLYDPNDGGGDGQPGAGDSNANAGGNDGNRADTSRAAANTGGSTGGGYKQDAQGNWTDASGKRLYIYTEDRTDFVPRYRLNDESGKRTAIERERDELKANLEREQKRVRAAMGIDPQDPKVQEQEEVEATLLAILGKKIPALDRLMKLSPEQLDQVIHGSVAGQAAQDSAADAQRDAAFESVYTEAAKLLRKDNLSDRQKRGLKEAFATEFRAAMQDRNTRRQQGQEIDPNDFVGRYLRNDRTLYTQFAKEYLGDWYEDARRNVTTTTVRRQNRAVPNGGRGETVVTQAPKHDLTTKDGFKKAMIEARNAGQ